MAVTQVYFSPGGATLAVAEYFTASLTREPVASLDLLREDARSVPNFGPDDLLVVNMPVFAGRLPQVCPAMLAELKGVSFDGERGWVAGDATHPDAPRRPDTDRAVLAALRARLEAELMALVPQPGATAAPDAVEKSEEAAG